MSEKGKLLTWVAFFSQTGGEIANIHKTLNFSPQIIITNKTLSEIKHLELYRKFSDKTFILPKNPRLDDYLNIFSKLKIKRSSSLITLHGFLRIIPEELCHYNIINLHPGLINTYPCLKGLNPQNKAYNLKHKRIGCVLHKVAPVVDSGKIIAHIAGKSSGNFEKDMMLYRKMSLKLWIKFLNDIKEQIKS